MNSMGIGSSKEEIGLPAPARGQCCDFGVENLAAESRNDCRGFRYWRTGACRQELSSTKLSVI
jgi:hypothetical protein